MKEQMAPGDHVDSSVSSAHRRTWHRVMHAIWVVTWLGICVMGLVTLLTWFAMNFWLADLLANLRVQQMIALVCLSVIAVALRRWRWGCIAVAMMVVHLPSFSSLLASGPAVERDSSCDLTVMVANVLTSNPQHDAVIEQVRQSDADVVAILELGPPLHASLEQTIASIYPHRITLPSDVGNFGIGLYSRWPLEKSDQFSLNIRRIHSIAATIRKDGHAYRVVATHPLPPMGASGFRNRNDHLTQLGHRLADYRKRNPQEHVILMGDLNLTPWSPIFDEFLTGVDLDWVGQGMGIREGLQPTWYAKNWRAKDWYPLGLVLDHVLISREMQVQSRRVGSFNGSDHRAVVVGVNARAKVAATSGS